MPDTLIKAWLFRRTILYVRSVTARLRPMSPFVRPRLTQAARLSPSRPAPGTSTGLADASYGSICQCGRQAGTDQTSGPVTRCRCLRARMHALHSCTLPALGNIAVSLASLAGFADPSLYISPRVVSTGQTGSAVWFPRPGKHIRSNRAQPKQCTSRHTPMPHVRTLTSLSLDDSFFPRSETLLHLSVSHTHSIGITHGVSVTAQHRSVAGCTARRTTPKILLLLDKYVLGRSQSCILRHHSYVYKYWYVPL